MTASAISCISNWSSVILHGVNPTGKEIGRGAYGRVFEVDYEDTLCAAKEIHSLLLQYSQDENLQKIKDDFLSECQIWSTLRHTCIVQFLGLYYPTTNQCRLPVIIMEKMECSLRNLVEKYDSIPLNVKLSILYEVSLGLRYLHSRNPPIVHRDLNPNNVLLGGHLEAKITDLGVAKIIKTDNQKTMTRLPGTPDYMPPEALSVRPVYGPSLDVFSYGAVILNVITQLWPQPTDMVQFNPDTGKRELVSEVTRRQCYLDKMTGDAVDLKPLVMSCLDDHSKCRPTAVQVSIMIKKAKDACSQKGSYDGMNPVVWWGKVSCKQESQLTSSLKEITINSEQLTRETLALKNENDAVLDKNTQLKTDYNAIKNENEKLKIEIERLKQQLVSNDPLRANIRWEEAAPALVNRSGHTAVLLNGLVYVGGGYEAQLRESFTISCYNVVTNKWTFFIKNFLHCLFAMTTLNNNLLFVGGRNKSHGTADQILTWDSNFLKCTANMTTPRSLCTAASHQGMLIITGGIDNKGKKLSSTEVFDSSTKQSFICGNLPQPHYWLQSVVVDNTLYLLGGVDQHDKFSHAVFTASLDTLSRGQLMWNTCQDTPRSCPGPLSIHGRHLLILGGHQHVENHITISSDIYKYNKANSSWEAMGHIPSPRYSLAAVAVADNKIVIIGGENNKREYTNTVWIGSCK